MKTVELRDEQVSEPIGLADVTPELQAQIDQFTVQNSGYYRKQFALLGQVYGFKATFNFLAALFGPVWYGSRNLWGWVIPFAALELIAFVFIAQGLWGDLGYANRMRAESIAKTVDMRQGQLEESLKAGADNIEALQRVLKSLEKSVQASTNAAEAAQTQAFYYVFFGVVFLIVTKLLAGVVANWALEGRFREWRSNRSMSTGIQPLSILIVSGFCLLSYVIAAIHFAKPGLWKFITSFPANRELRTSSASVIKGAFDYVTIAWESFFDLIRFGINGLLELITAVLTAPPWPVIVLFFLIIAWRMAGSRVAVFTAAVLFYLGYLDFWDKAMDTISLLGTAAFISIVFGIPIGVIGAKSERMYMLIRPILDFMQTMPSFVYLIPVIAFFGTGKPSAIIATMVFGSPPVIRMTILGLRQVPSDVREAALAFGASPLFMLFKVDIPLAAPTIMAGVNQTIMLSLAMVVIASLIGAEGLGENVLEALQYASEGEGMLAGLAILLCAMMLDRIILGWKK